MQELKLGPATKPVDFDICYDTYSARLSTEEVYEIRNEIGEVTDFCTRSVTSLNPGYTAHKRFVISLDNHKFVVDYEIIPDAERRRAALLASAKSKLTDEEWHAVTKQCELHELCAL